MSDNWIALIPADPGFVPAPELQRRAEATLRQLAPEAEEIASSVSDGLEFHDCGGNLGSIRCPRCDAELDLQWWHQAMDEDRTPAGFCLRHKAMPCCGGSATLHELRYDWEQGFSRYCLEAMNPHIGTLSAEQVAEFETLLGCRLRVIYQHF